MVFHPFTTILHSQYTRRLWQDGYLSPQYYPKKPKILCENCAPKIYQRGSVICVEEDTRSWLTRSLGVYIGRNWRTRFIRYVPTHHSFYNDINMLTELSRVLSYQIFDTQATPDTLTNTTHHRQPRGTNTPMRCSRNTTHLSATSKKPRPCSLLPSVCILMAFSLLSIFPENNLIQLLCMHS